MHRKVFLVGLIWIALIGCSNNSNGPANKQTDFNQLRASYAEALNLWNMHNIADYQIVVKLFSSCLPPPCNSECVLSVHGDQLIGIDEIETPQPLKNPKGTVFYNPRCHDYERYIPSNLFDSTNLLLNDPIQQKGLNLSFTYDPTYGYITRYEMHYDGSECYEHFEFSGFQPMRSK